MRPGERHREFLVADLALDLELATAVDVGAALSRFLTEGGSFLEQPSGSGAAPPSEEDTA